MTVRFALVVAIVLLTIALALAFAIVAGVRMLVGGPED